MEARDSTAERLGWKRRLLVAAMSVAALALAGPFTAPAAASGGEHSHFRYGSLRWQSVNPATGEVVIHLTAAFRRDSNWGPVDPGAIITETQGPTQLNFGDGSVTGTLQFLITASSPSENWVIGEALDPATGAVGIHHTYSGPGPFTAYLAGFVFGPIGGLTNVACCRIGQAGFATTPGLNNRAGNPYPLQTIIRPTTGNSSPESTLATIVFVPESSAATFLVPAADPNGDPIQFRMSTDDEAGGGPHPPGISINSSTGIVTWNNVGLDKALFWTTQVVIEDLDAAGNVKSQSVVDFLLKIVEGNPPVFDTPPSPCGQTLTVGQSQNITFTIQASDPDSGQTVTLNHAGLPAGASFPLPAGANPVSSVFSWTPTPAQTGITIVTFLATDSAGLGSTPCSVIIEVLADTTSPVLTPTATKADGTPYVAGEWTNQDVTVTWSCADEPGGSGVASFSPASETFMSEGAGQSSMATCSDNAGNTATATFSPINIDRTAPRVGCNESVNPSGGNIPPAGSTTLPGSKGGQNEDGFYVGNASDGGSGVVAMWLSDTGSSFIEPLTDGMVFKLIQAPGVTPNSKPGVGAVSKKIQIKGDGVVNATDAAGNTASAPCNVPPPPK